MAHFDQVGEFGLNEVLAKRLTTPGGAVAPTVAPEMFPTLVLENDRPEWGYLKGEHRYCNYVSVAALAANFSMVQLYLPTTSRSIAVITSVRSISATVMNIYRLVGISGGLGGWTASTTRATDSRQNGNGSAVIVETNQNVAAPTGFGLMTVLVAAQQKFEVPLVIAPGGAFAVCASVANNAIQLEVSWYERPAQPGELV